MFKKCYYYVIKLTRKVRVYHSNSMARGPEGPAPRLSKEAHLVQLKQERGEKAEAKTAERETKLEARSAKSAENKEKREQFFNDLKSGAESTWKNVKGLGPKAADFMKTKANQGQDMLDSLSASARYPKQELPHKIQDYKEKRDIKKGLAQYEKEFSQADARKKTRDDKEKWDRKVAETKAVWKGKVDTAKEWGTNRVTEVMGAARDAKHKHWDIPVNNIKVKRVDGKLAKERGMLYKEGVMNFREIDKLMARVTELKTQNKGLGEQLKFLSDSEVERGSADRVIGTADLSKKAAWMNQGNADLSTLFTMRSAS